MLVSIVMPSYNQDAYLSEAIDSVLDQSWQNLELIVMDGGSSDDSVEILRCYARKDTRLRWWSEADGGPANAINKALRHCRGSYIGWLNSDDRYTGGAVDRAMNLLLSNRQMVMCYGRAKHIDGDGVEIDEYPTTPESHQNQKNIENTIPSVAEFLKGCFICQPTVFFKRSMSLLLGDLDESLRASFDFDYWVRAFQSFENRIGFIDGFQADSRLHEECITRQQRHVVAEEGVVILHRYLDEVPSHWILSYVEEQKVQGLAESSISHNLSDLLFLIKKKVSSHHWNQLLAAVRAGLDHSIEISDKLL